MCPGNTISPIQFDKLPRVSIEFIIPISFIVYSKNIIMNHNVLNNEWYLTLTIKKIKSILTHKLRSKKVTSVELISSRGPEGPMWCFSLMTLSYVLTTNCGSSLSFSSIVYLSCTEVDVVQFFLFSLYNVISY